MKWFDNLKFQNKFLVVLGILAVFMISFAIYTVTQVNKVQGDIDQIVSYQKRQFRIADSIVNTYSFRIANLARGYAVETDQFENVLNLILRQYDKNVKSFHENLDSFRELVMLDVYITEEERELRLNMLYPIEISYNFYMGYIEQLKIAVENNDRQEVIHVMEQTIPAGNIFSSRLLGLRDLTFYSAMQKSLEATENANMIKNVVVVVVTAFIILVIFALLFTVNSITRPIAELAQSVTEIANGNLTHQIRSERKDELGVLANCISDMVNTVSEHNKMEAIMDNMDSEVCVMDLEHNVLFMNKSMATTYGVDREKIIGQKCYNSFKKSDVPCSFCLLGELLPDKESLPSRYYEYLYDEDSKVWLQGTSSIIKWVDGSLAYFESRRDVTHKKQQEQLLVEALHKAKMATLAKSSFLANMSHEIRTPMNAILGVSEIQLQNEELSPNTLEALSIISNSGNLLLGIINDILDLSKIEAGKLELVSCNYETASLINDTIMLNMMRIGSKQIDFKLSVDENIPAVLNGDELRLKQIITNLLSNAFKYTEKGMIKLSFFCEKGNEEYDVMLVCTVSDTGQGMTEEQLSKLFSEYSRFNVEANRATEGTGLGMSITHNLIKLMNGKISVESEPEKGSVFTVCIPQKSTGSNVLGKELADNLQKFEKLSNKQIRKTQIVFEPMPYGTILLVDDVEANLYVAKGLMVPYGLSIETVMSGFEAIAKIKSNKVYDIVFMDHMMPKMDGIEATLKMRELGYKHPIVALTANALVGQSEMFLANGFDDFISKPIDVRQLDTALKKYVRDKQPPEVVEAANREKGKRQAFNNPALSPEFAAVFVRSAIKFTTELEEILKKDGIYKDEEIRLYTINTHSLKTMLANAGEKELSAVAFKLEQAGRERNLSVMSKETPGFLKEMQAIVQKIRLKIEGKENTVKAVKAADEDIEYLREKLLVIKEACGMYDRKTIKSAIAELKQKEWSLQTMAILDTIAEHLLNGDYDKISSLAGKSLL